MYHLVGTLSGWKSNSSSLLFSCGSLSPLHTPSIVNGELRVACPRPKKRVLSNNSELRDCANSAAEADGFRVNGRYGKYEANATAAWKPVSFEDQ